MIRISIEPLTKEALLFYNDKMICGIYCFINKHNGKRYIGQSADIERRILDHKRYLARGKDNCTLLQNAYNKYGKDSFDLEILVECETSQLDELEKYYITLFNTTSREFGYNLSSGGSDGLLGHKKSEETRRRMSIANTKERHPMWGKKHSPETIQRYKEIRGGEKAYQFGAKTEKPTSKYFGVCRMISKGHIYWIAYVKVKGTRNHIGSSKVEETAARMYDKFIVENGLPNPLNFPDNVEIK